MSVFSLILAFAPAVFAAPLQTLSASQVRSVPAPALPAPAAAAMPVRAQAVFAPAAQTPPSVVSVQVFQRDARSSGGPRSPESAIAKLFDGGAGGRVANDGYYDVHGRPASVGFAGKVAAPQVSNEYVYIAADAVAAFKGLPWGRAHYERRRAAGAAALSRLGATNLQIKQYHRLLKDAPLRGGRFRRRQIAKPAQKK